MTESAATFVAALVAAIAAIIAAGFAIVGARRTNYTNAIVASRIPLDFRIARGFLEALC